MKKLPKFILLFFLLTLLSSFLTKNYFNVEPPSLGGIKQIFVNSYKQIKSSDSLISVLSFKNKVNDSTLSSFQIFTFKFAHCLIKLLDAGAPPNKIFSN